ncbi:MAG: alpha/beta fold hydrolase, partial [Burkholderiaceae bacterium]
MFSNFEKEQRHVNGINLNFVYGGNGPPLLLLHGHPQTHVIWHKVADQLAERFTVVAADLRGYGDSNKPKGLPDHSNYSKRIMAQDQVNLMEALGFQQFHVIGHDRGGRVAHRMAVDHPERVRQLVTLDIAPTLAMYEKTTLEFARSYYHWFFLIQTAPFPETMLMADPELYLKRSIGGRSAGLAPFTAEAYAEYVRCIKDPGTIHGLCEDYRASAGIDLEHDREDRASGKKIRCEMLALWG